MMLCPCPEFHCFIACAIVSPPTLNWKKFPSSIVTQWISQVVLKMVAIAGFSVENICSVCDCSWSAHAMVAFVLGPWPSSPVRISAGGEAEEGCVSRRQYSALRGAPAVRNQSGGPRLLTHQTYQTGPGRESMASGRTAGGTGLRERVVAGGPHHVSV